MTTLNHDEAIARVTVDGLGLCCFNSTDKKWDLAFIRHTEETLCHQLILDIEGQQSINVKESANLITFEVKGQFPAGFPRGYFDNGLIQNRTVKPSAGAETENFRWVIDLETDVPHGFIGLKKPRPPIRLTRTYIHNAVFYTLNVSSRSLVLVHDTENPNGMINPPFFGQTNDEISADIFCDPGEKLVIRIDGVQQGPALEQRSGNPWKICLTNLCIRKPAAIRFSKGDFQNLYEIIDISGEKFALWGEPLPGLAQCHSEINVGSGRDTNAARFGPVLVLGRPDCDTTRLGTIETLDPLFS